MRMITMLILVGIEEENGKSEEDDCHFEFTHNGSDKGDDYEDCHDIIVVGIRFSRWESLHCLRQICHSQVHIHLEI